MKYMGSKRSLLERGLDGVLMTQCADATRFVDLFCGAGSVSWFAAQHCGLPVLSVDLQMYATVLAGAVTTRDEPLIAEDLESAWLTRAEEVARGDSRWTTALQLKNRQGTSEGVARSREVCAAVDGGPVWTAYGGYYFSPWQSLLLDAMLATLPVDEPAHTVCLAATITSACESAASPGHTAQPFRPTESGLPFIDQCWSLNPIDRARRAVALLAPLHAVEVGETRVDDAAQAAKELTAADLVFIDPPYAAEQYSRFYHVLETIARQSRVDVSGSGRYPSPEERPRSSFSLKSKASDTMTQLVADMASVGARGIVTFPAGECSNGLSGAGLVDMVDDLFVVTCYLANGCFSTLGGNNALRASRKPSDELILVLEPK